MHNPDLYCRMLECNGEACGACVGELREELLTGERVAQVSFIYVHPHVRFGLTPVRYLLADFETWGRSRAAKATLLAHPSARLAQRLGYAAVDMIHRKELV